MKTFIVWSCYCALVDSQCPISDPRLLIIRLSMTVRAWLAKLRSMKRLRECMLKFLWFKPTELMSVWTRFGSALA